MLLHICTCMMWLQLNVASCTCMDVAAAKCCYIYVHDVAAAKCGYLYLSRKISTCICKHYSGQCSLWVVMCDLIDNEFISPRAATFLNSKDTLKLRIWLGTIHVVRRQNENVFFAENRAHSLFSRVVLCHYVTHSQHHNYPQIDGVSELCSRFRSTHRKLPITNTAHGGLPGKTCNWHRKSVITT
jgi:hypothetical protein